ncbi:MSP domain protein [Ancylostoma caninum]|uniref:Major sperm protein n=1 Tax=Ancylostoma caninum TaxID=29170 RepID=A0A368FI81_ANCCA|nr:MSP domain protein [Ancylostoma caninum]
MHIFFTGLLRQNWKGEVREVERQSDLSRGYKSKNFLARKKKRCCKKEELLKDISGAGEANRKVADRAEVTGEAAEAGGLTRAGEESPSHEARARAGEAARARDPDRSPGQGAEGQNRVEALGVLLLLLFQRALPAKPSELRVEPAELSYKAIGGLKGVSVINDTQERKFFKVKCSDNMLYRVNPVFGAVEPGKSARIDILRQNGGAKIDKIVLVTTKAQEGEIPCREVFNQGRSTEMMVLPLLVQE